LEQYIYNETRYTMLQQSHPETAKRLLEEAQQDVRDRWKIYEMWAHMVVNRRVKAEEPAPQDTARITAGYFLGPEGRSTS
jgi:hypothetical protein